MISSKKKKVLSAALSLTMIGSMVAAVPFTASAATAGTVSYSIYENKAWHAGQNGAAVGNANKGYKVEAFEAASSDVSLTYKVYENKAWHSASDGAAVGNANKGYSVEALGITSNDPNYDVTYSVYENKAWHAGSDGALVGNANKGYAVEAVKVTVTAKKSAATVTSIAPVSVTTAVGTAPVLPTTVTATLSDGTTKDEAVTWDTVDAASYAKAGTFAVSGTIADSTTVKATANVTVADVAIKDVSVTDTNKILVDFTGAVDTSKVTVALKQGYATLYTTTAFADDKQSATLTAPVAFASGDYTVDVSGIGTADLTAPITVKDAVPQSITVKTTQVSDAATATAVDFTVNNQYGTDMKVTSDDSNLTASAFDTTANLAISVAKVATKSEYTLNTTDTAVKVGDTIRFIISYKGITLTQNLTVISPASIATISLGTVSPLKDTTRITTGDKTLVIPVTAVDQYGNAVKLTADDIANGGTVSVISSDSSIAGNFGVNTDGNITFDAEGAGTATITAIVNNAAGSIAKTTVVVNSAAALKTLAIASPTGIVAANDAAFTLKLTGYDQFGGEVKDLTGTTIVATSSDTTVLKGDVTSGVFTVTPVAKGTATLTLKSSDGKTTYATITINVVDNAVPTAIVGVNVPTTFEANANKTFKLSDIKVKDQYGRDFALKSVGDVTVAKTNTNDTDYFTISNNGTDSFTLAAGATAGSESITYTLKANSATYVANYKVVDTASISSYDITNAQTIFANVGTNPLTEDYTLALAIEGKLSDGTVVVLDDGKVNHATTSDKNIATVTDDGIVTGLAKGTSVITLYNDGTVLASATITVSDVAPVATTVTIDDTTPFTVAAGKTTPDVAANVTVKDQYGVDITADTTGFWASSDSSIASVDKDTGVVTGVKVGSVTIKYITSNGIIAQTTVTVTPA